MMNMLPFLEIGIVSIVIGIISLSIARIFQWSREQVTDESKDGSQQWVLYELFPSRGYHPQFSEVFFEQWSTLLQKDVPVMLQHHGLTFEVHSDKGNLHMYLRVHAASAQMCLQMLNEAFPEVKVVEVIDPLTSWNKDIYQPLTPELTQKSLFEVALTENSLYPIKQYNEMMNDPHIISDPFQLLLLALRDIPQNQYAVLQFGFTPAQKPLDQWQNNFESLRKEYSSESEDADGSSQQKYLTKHEKELLVSVKDKLSSNVFKTSLRCGVFGQNAEEIKNTISTFNIYFDEFRTDIQSFIFRSPQNISEDVKTHEQSSFISQGLLFLSRRIPFLKGHNWSQEIYDAFLQRRLSPVDDRSEILFSSRDIASLVHLPIQAAQLPVQPLEERVQAVQQLEQTQQMQLPEPQPEPTVVPSPELEALRNGMYKASEPEQVEPVHIQQTEEISLELLKDNDEFVFEETPSVEDNYTPTEEIVDDSVFDFLKDIQVDNQPAAELFENDYVNEEEAPQHESPIGQDYSDVFSSELSQSILNRIQGK